MIKNTLYLVLVVFAAACAPTTRVLQISDNVYRISKDGGWGYDLKALQQDVRNQAKNFSAAAGKDFEIIDEKVTPDARVDIYPADDDTYAITFRLIDRKTPQRKD
jgi:hypothetical protein